MPSPSWGRVPCDAARMVSPCAAGCGPLELVVTVEAGGTDHDVHPEQGTTQVLVHVEWCPVCGDGRYVHHDHDCTGWPTSASFPIEGEWTQPVAAGDVDRLREGFRGCPDPADGGCGCPAHRSLRASQDLLRQRPGDPVPVAAAVELAGGLPQLRPVFRR